jgi:hypothetical protein
MVLNLEKCKVMSFYTNKHPILINYNINNVQLEIMNDIKDLGVTFQYNLKFNLYYSEIKSKALRMLGFLYRHTILSLHMKNE